ncbi:hypothetical protein SUNI508_06882 [Seiridium unicorne]|uniref:Uncharacterized protein n=1 Tax=Seiridium unicorne TaxID=138068 RepID=A0ABR2V043_9PEZI
MCADSFKGVSASPRKINAIINQYGFEFKGGKVLPMPGAPRVRANLFSAATAAARAAARAPACPATRAAAPALAKRNANKVVKRASAALKKRRINMPHTSNEDEDGDVEI